MLGDGSLLSLSRVFPRLEEEHGDKVVHSSHHLKDGTFLTLFQGWDILHIISRAMG